MLPSKTLSKSFAQYERHSALLRTVADGCRRLRTLRQQVANPSDQSSTRILCYEFEKKKSTCPSLADPPRLFNTSLPLTHVPPNTVAFSWAKDSPRSRGARVHEASAASRPGERSRGPPQGV